MGFGAAEGVALLTLVILPIARELVLFLLKEVIKKEGAPAANRLVRELFVRFRGAADASAPVLGAEQLARARELALVKARAAGLDQEKAALLADAVVGGLAVVQE